MKYIGHIDKERINPVKKSIGWCDITRNPIKGRCLGGCWYCYYSGRRGMLNRFKQNPKIRFKPSVLLDLPKSPKKIFLCSTHDLFGDWIPRSWRDILFDIWIPNNSQHIFQILTKFPQNIDRPMPDNVWLGVTATNHGDLIKTWQLGRKEAEIRFVSIEPMFDFLNPRDLYYKTKWIIMGRLTQHGNKHDPKKEWIEKWVRYARWHDIPIFLKDNLKEIWGEPLIQEFPE